MTDSDSNVPSETILPPTTPNHDVSKAENIVTALLKAPHEVSSAIAEEKNLPSSAVILLAAAIACHAVFGLAVGMFGGVTVAAMDVVKFPLVAICSLLLCFPSLYVFTCVAGAPLSLWQTFVLGCSCLAMVGLLLVGLAPVVWLFAVSTESMPFVVVLTTLIWGVALSFASRYVGKLKDNPHFARQAGIKLWFVILMVVTLQMVTCMRPMLTKPDKGWWTGEKKFFLSHFGSTFEQPKQAPNQGNPR